MPARGVAAASDVGRFENPALPVAGWDPNLAGGALDVWNVLASTATAPTMARMPTMTVTRRQKKVRAVGRRRGCAWPTY
jgi:hypothetical protein